MLPTAEGMYQLSEENRGRVPSGPLPTVCEFLFCCSHRVGARTESCGSPNLPKRRKMNPRPPFDQSLEVREAPRGALRGMLDYRGVDQEQAGQEEDDESRGGASHEVQHRAEVGDRDGDGGRERDEEGGPERGTRFRGAPLGDGAEDVLGRGAGWVMVERVVREDDAAF